MLVDVQGTTKKELAKNFMELYANACFQSGVTMDQARDYSDIALDEIYTKKVLEAPVATKSK